MWWLVRVVRRWLEDERSCSFKPSSSSSIYTSIVCACVYGGVGVGGITVSPSCWSSLHHTVSTSFVTFDNVFYQDSDFD